MEVYLKRQNKFYFRTIDREQAEVVPLPDGSLFEKVRTIDREQA